LGKTGTRYLKRNQRRRRIEMKKYTTKTCIVNKNKTKGRKKSTNTFMIKKGICGNRKK
tara:strand:+ start:834 stop:1007 length:174 start_codon:yes stop_codon:yes gene_type:complete